MQKPGIGLVGLGTMGAALALNIAEKGFPIAVWNRTGSVTEEFVAGAGALAGRIVPAKTLEGLVAAMLDEPLYRSHLESLVPSDIPAGSPNRAVDFESSTIISCCSCIARIATGMSDS